MELGKRLKKCRLEKGYSQYRLSDISGVPRITIIRIERGEVDPRMSTLRRISKALGVEVSDFLNKTKEDKEAVRMVVACPCGFQHENASLSKALSVADEHYEANPCGRAVGENGQDNITITILDSHGQKYKLVSLREKKERAVKPVESGEEEFGVKGGL
jgi:DNA-binding XRE family transcriptional regulator